MRKQNAMLPRWSSEAVSEQQDGDAVLIRQEHTDKNLFQIKKVPGGQAAGTFLYVLYALCNSVDQLLGAVPIKTWISD